MQIAKWLCEKCGCMIANPRRVHEKWCGIPVVKIAGVDRCDGCGRTLPEHDPEGCDLDPDPLWTAILSVLRKSRPGNPYHRLAVSEVVKGLRELGRNESATVVRRCLSSKSTAGLLTRTVGRPALYREA